jgi:transposase-like protein
VEFADFTTDEAPDDRRQNGTDRPAAEGRRRRFLRSVAEAVLQILMEADVEDMIGAERHTRSAERLNWRKGYRDRTLDTQLGSKQLRIPKQRQGSSFPPFLEPRKTSEKALIAVIQEAWIAGVSMRKVDDLVQVMGPTGISRSQVSTLCQDIDERVGAFLERPIERQRPRPGATWPTSSVPAGRSSASSWTTARTTCSPPWRSQRSTGPSCTR